MAIERAIFKKISGQTVLVCNTCGQIVKLERDFDVNEKFAANGTISMMPRYCSKHEHLNVYESKKEIKKLLREGMMRKNASNIEITRPDQELVIMRGIPGSGKSTKAKTLVGEGIIHSTDDLIEATGDYNGYFKKMVESKDWSAHGRMHRTNLLNAKASMLDGVSPVIIDNTNIKASESKKYVEVALKMGMDEANITIVDVADGGCTAEILAERNTHNVPLKTIKRMLASHKGVGNLTVQRILEAKGGVKNAPKQKVLYNGVMLDGTSKSKLLSAVGQFIPEGWKTFAHHMTISFGKPLENRGNIGSFVTLRAHEIGISDMAIAVKVEGYPSDNKIPHITVAVNVNEGGKPVMSNNITEWKRLDEVITLEGKVAEVLNF
jgi:predicted kinase